MRAHTVSGLWQHFFQTVNSLTTTVEPLVLNLLALLNSTTSHTPSANSVVPMYWTVSISPLTNTLIPSSRTGSGEVARERGGEEEEGRWGEGPLCAEEDFDRTCFDFKREVTLGTRSEGERGRFINGCLYMKDSEAL